ncbi:MAG: hypothetical protein NVS4B3_19530 [Gemmatimonadaceae bacterium]
MRAEEVRELTDAELRGRILELEEERFRLRFRSATETLENPLRLRTVRRDVARMKTVLRERELAATAGETARAGSAVTPAAKTPATPAARRAKR